MFVSYKDYIKCKFCPKGSSNSKSHSVIKTFIHPRKKICTDVIYISLNASIVKYHSQKLEVNAYIFMKSH